MPSGSIRGDPGAKRGLELKEGGVDISSGALDEMTDNAMSETLMFGINFLILSNSLRLSNSISTVCPTITTLFVYKM